MPKLSWVVLLIFAWASLADESQVILESWRFGDDYVIFVNLNKGIKINKGCEDSKSKCEVWKILAQVSMKNLKASDISGGKNMGASLCHQQSKARIVFARNTVGSQATFCAFSDGSMVDSGGLLLAAKMNDVNNKVKP